MIVSRAAGRSQIGRASRHARQEEISVFASISGKGLLLFKSHAQHVADIAHDEANMAMHPLDGNGLLIAVLGAHQIVASLGYFDNRGILKCSLSCFEAHASVNDDILPAILL